LVDGVEVNLDKASTVDVNMTLVDTFRRSGPQLSARWEWGDISYIRSKMSTFVGGNVHVGREDTETEARNAADYLFHLARSESYQRFL